MHQLRYRQLVKAFALAAVLTCSWAAMAETCARPADSSGESIAAQSDSSRLSYLSALLSEESGNARLRALGWGGTFGVLTIGQLVAIPLLPSDMAPDLYWGALSAALGAAFIVLDPLEVLEAGPRFAQRVRSSSPDDACALIAEGERLLQSGAQAEVDGRRWYIHVGNVLFNVGLGLLLGFGYGHWSSGFLNMGVGIAVGEATIFISPSKLIAGWEQYLRGSAKPTAVSLSLVAAPGPGVGVLLRF